MTLTYTHRLRQVALAVCCLGLVNGCATPELLGEDLWEYTPEERAKRVALFTSTQTPAKELPLLLEQLQYEKYADLFGTACLSKSLTESVSVFRANGFTEKRVSPYSIHSQGFAGLGELNYTNYDQRRELFEKVVPPEYRALALSMKNESGAVPLIQAIRERRADELPVYTDGIAEALVSVSSKTNDICTVSIRVPDDDPLVAELERVVRESGREPGPPVNNGIVGFGYLVGSPPTEIITLGRDRRASPTTFTYVLPRKK